MTEVPRLVDLCLATLADELLQRDQNHDIFSVIVELPPELFDALLPHLPPLALHKLQENLPADFRDNFGYAFDDNRGCRKRRRLAERYNILDTTWLALYKARWPGNDEQKKPVNWLNKHEEKTCEIRDWQQMYWEAHLQECIDAVLETALLPSYDGSIGKTQIPEFILGQIGCKGHWTKLTCNYSEFSHHCQQFGVYARHLRLPNALCTAETCDLLQNTKLINLEVHWIKYIDHVEGLCKLLNQNSETLKSVEFIHCKLSSAFINAICDSLHMKDLQTHGVEHFSIKRSSIFQTDSSHIPVGLASLLTTGRSLHSLTLCDDHLGRNFARGIFNSLLDASTSISMLDLSENNISGFLSQPRWRSSSCSLELGKPLQSLRVLNLRGCNLEREDACSLKQALGQMPNLQNLDLSDNPIAGGLRSLISYFTEISSRDLPFTVLKLENCELLCTQVIELLGVLSTMNKQLNMLSIKDNRLGSNIGAPLGKYLCCGIISLDAGDIGLGSFGFLDAMEQISKELKIAYINISNNCGGFEAAQFISHLVKHAPKIIAIDAGYNLMPTESISEISSGLKASKGKLEHLDLAGNSLCNELADVESILAEFRSHGQSALNVSLLAASNAPYDNDP